MPRQRLRRNGAVGEKSMRITVVGIAVIVSAIVTPLLVLHHLRAEISNAKVRVDTPTGPDPESAGSQPSAGKTP
jgi:hypothetical protein